MAKSLLANSVAVDRRQAMASPIAKPISASSSDRLRSEIISASEMTSSLIQLWGKLRQANPLLSSPFFSYEFTQAVQAVRGDCKIAIVEIDNQIAGFLPYHSINGVAFPVGRMANDAQGFICSYETQLSVESLFDSMGVSSYQFHAWFSTFPLKRKAIHGWQPCFLANLTAQNQNYRQWLEQQHRTIKRQGQKNRKLERMVGPLRLEFQSQSPELFDYSIQLKRQHYHRTHIFDILSVPWLIELLRYFLITPGTVRGTNSVLWAGDQIVATHMGIRENSLLHYWFPAYDMQFSYGSPGTELFLQIADSAADHDIDKIDFGYGDQPYKHFLTNTQSRCPFGSFTPHLGQRIRQRLSRSLVHGLKAMPAKEAAKRLVRKYRPDWGRNQFR